MKSQTAFEINLLAWLKKKDLNVNINASYSRLLEHEPASTAKKKWGENNKLEIGQKSHYDCEKKINKLVLSG